MEINCDITYQWKELQSQIIYQKHILCQGQFGQEMIYFGDPQLVQKHLHQDLNTIIKNVKVRQEQHIELLQYNRSIVNRKRSIQTTTFINEEITTHNNVLYKVLEVNKALIKQEEEIVLKYDQATVRFESVIKLMARVMTRILQTNQSFIDKIKSYDESFYQQFNKMKRTLTKLLNNKQQIDLSLSTKTIIDYAKDKAVHQIEKLKLLIKSLQDGQMQKIPYIYKAINVPQVQIKVPQVQPQKVQTVRIEKAVQKKSSPPKKQGKHEIFSKIQDQIKASQKIKKQKKTVANRIITMCNTMDLSRKQFMQDIVYSNQKQQYDRIYGEMFLRNKFNHQQILQFESKRDQFQERVSLFKQLMMQESNKIQEVLMIRKPVRIQKRESTHPQSQSKLQTLNDQSKNPESIFEEQSPTRLIRRSFVLRQKAASPKFHREMDMAQLKVTQETFDHIRFDTSNKQIFLRSNRNCLPQIQNKPFGSVDNQQQFYLSKPKEGKGVARKNILMKNIQVGVQNVIKQNRHKNQSQSKSIAQKIKQIQPTASFNNNNVMQFTFYGSRRKSFALGQTRTNFAF